MAPSYQVVDIPGKSPSLDAKTWSVCGKLALFLLFGGLAIGAAMLVTGPLQFGRGAAGQDGSPVALSPNVTALVQLADTVANISTQLSVLMASDASISTRVANAETMTAGSSPLVTAVLSGVANSSFYDVTALNARINKSESLVVNSSPLVTAVLKAGSDITQQGVAIAAVTSTATALMGSDALRASAITQLVATDVFQNASLGALATGLSANGAAISGQAASITALNTLTATQATSITALNSGVAAQGSSITALNSSITAMNTLAATQATSITALSTLTTTLSAADAAQSAAMAGLVATDVYQNATLLGLSAGVAASAATVATQGSTITALSSTVAANSASLTTQAGTIASNTQALSNQAISIAGIVANVSLEATAIAGLNASLISNTHAIASVNATVIGNSAAIKALQAAPSPTSAVLTGYVAGSGVVSAGDTVLGAIEKLAGGSSGASVAFSPRLGDGGNFMAIQGGQSIYTLVGKLCFVAYELSWPQNSVPGAGMNNMQVTLPPGLPASSSVNARYSFTIGYYRGISVTSAIIGSTSVGSDHVDLMLQTISAPGVPDYGGSQLLTGSAFSTSSDGELQLSGWYFVD